MATKKNKATRSDAEDAAPRKKKKVRAYQEVTATRLGFYGNQRRFPGSTFRIPADEKLGSWMVPKDEYQGDEEETELEDDGESTGNEEVL